MQNIKWLIKIDEEKNKLLLEYKPYNLVTYSISLKNINSDLYTTTKK